MLGRRYCHIHDPWEYLYNAPLNRFLSLSEYTPLIRYLDLPERIRPLTVAAPLEILVIISSPTDYPSLKVEHEWSRLNKALAGLTESGQVRLASIAPMPVRINSPFASITSKPQSCAAWSPKGV